MLSFTLLLVLSTIDEMFSPLRPAPFPSVACFAAVCRTIPTVSISFLWSLFRLLSSPVFFLLMSAFLHPIHPHNAVSQLGMSLASRSMRLRPRTLSTSRDELHRAQSKDDHAQEVRAHVPGSNLRRLATRPTDHLPADPCAT